MEPIITKYHNLSNYQGNKIRAWFRDLCQNAICGFSHHEFLLACDAGHLFLKSIDFRGHNPTHLQEKQKTNILTKAIVHF